jgi:predicted Na+-dependent transporter
VWICGILATLRIFLTRATVQIDFFASMSPNDNRGAVMSITALILVLLLPFAVGFVLHRLEAGRKMRRFC